MEDVKNILSLNSNEAMDYFMKSEQYHGFELPEYFVFDELLDSVKARIADTPYAECLEQGMSPERLSDVNLDILLNKDGRYAVRPIILANPYLYYFLVRELCNEESWITVKDLFSKFQVPHISSCALPVIAKKKEAFYKSTTILNWWNAMEQRSIELSLEYRYMFVTDISNCYGSINPQAFDWAFSLKDTLYDKKCDSPISANIQKYLRAFQHGRNIGIPQGSAIFDFVGEIILGYADLLLHEAIQQNRITSSYEIIRYRDDYRIFCNDKDALETISYVLQHVLERLNFRMNSRKTKISQSIITDSVKTDKLAYIFNTPIATKRDVDFDSFEKHLLFILLFARQHPNSGTVKTLLSDIDKRIENWLKPRTRKVQALNLFFDDNTEVEDNTSQDSEEKIETYQQCLVGGSVRAMSAICVQIALENVNCCHYALRVLSRIVDSLKDEQEKWSIIELVKAKLINQPNSTYNLLWLQNITYQKDRIGKSPYDIRLCKVVMGEDTVLWNNTWLKKEFTTGVEQTSVVSAEVLEKVTPVITFRETRAYNEALDDESM